MKQIVVVLFLYLCFWGNAQPDSFDNPILSGFYPDPSICRVGDDYYLVNSSFEWWPGIPIWHSRDLVNWEQIGNVIHRKGQICSNPNIWAPTIRYYQGKFYVICTERPGAVFFVTADNPAGPWSDAVYFDISKNEVSPIDPSLFWDDDGTCWLASNDRQKSGTIKHWVWIQKVDLNPVQRNGRMEASFIGERRYITDGSGVGADNYAEGPHLFKVNGLYYLMIAEGGTWDNHAVSFLRTNDLEKPAEEWEYCPFNPVLTHRNKESAISATGHADMVQTQNGEWWMVHLGVRKQDGKHKLGRETFLVPILWKTDSLGRKWPIANPLKGNQTLLNDKRPDLEWSPFKILPVSDNFENERLGLQYNFYNEPEDFDWYKIENNRLKIKLLPARVSDKGHCAFIARRQTHHNFNVETELIFNPESENEVAGMMAGIKNTNHIRVEISKLGDEAFASLVYVSVNGEKRVIRKRIPTANSKYSIHLEARGWDFQFYIGIDKGQWLKLGGVQDARIMSSEIAKGFTGSYVGMFASSNGKHSDTWCEFDYFKYEPLQSN
ncbi:glycoside hydrolase family 43 protein [Draconibacterium sp.]|uniref:glycoside hydrolase family 43 protein n=1 Tax=Draconibacterium sp. TaxID=1965318 RepID=UPI003565518E